MKPIIYVFGEGLVGSRIVSALRENKHVTVVTNKQAPHGSRIRSTPAGIDIERILVDMTQTFGAPDLIINALGIVGKPNVEWCEDNKHETLYGNVDIPVDLGWAAAKRGIPMIHISTGCIFSDTEGKTIFSTDAEPNFLESFYSRTKADAEYQLRMLQEHNPEARIEIHRIRMPFFVDDDPRNLINKLLAYDTLVDSPNSMTCLEDYVDYVVKRAEEIIADAPDEFEPKGWFSIQHAVNKEPLAHSEIIEFLKEFGNVDVGKKTYITPKELNKMCKTPRSNCILGEEQLPATRVSMLRTVRDYKLNKK